MPMQYIKCEKDRALVHKQLDQTSCHEVLCADPSALLAPRVELERFITAAQDICHELVKKKYVEHKGIATSQIDPAVRVNYYGTTFWIDHTMSYDDAMESYHRVIRDSRRQALGLKLVR